MLEDGTKICMGSSSDIGKFDIVSMDRDVTDAEGRLVWELGIAAGGDVAASREIRQLKYLDLRKLASLYIIVDMERLIRDALANAGYSPETSRLVMMADGKRFYPETPYHDDRYDDLLSAMTLHGTSYSVEALDRNKEFIIAGSIAYTGWDYLYFRDYDPIFHDIQAAASGYSYFPPASELSPCCW